MQIRQKEAGITLVALVITVIILLILAGVAMSLITGEGGLFARANHAGYRYNEVSYNEAVRYNELDALMAQYIGDGGNGGGGVTPTPTPTPTVLTFGDMFDQKEEAGEGQSLIGRNIDYVSGNNDSAIQTAGGWIILGSKLNEQGKNDILITTKNPVSTQTISCSLAEWVGYETTINNACKNYVGQIGTLGENTIEIKDIRSITIEDINNAVGFNETITPVTISDENGGYAYPNEAGTGWVINTDEEYDSYTFPIPAYNYYNNNGIYVLNCPANAISDEEIELGKPANMNYILANDTEYWVASRSVDLGSGDAGFCVAHVNEGGIFSGNYYWANFCYADTEGGVGLGGSHSFAFRPVVVLSSDIPWDDVENLIHDYASYE